MTLKKILAATLLAIGALTSIGAIAASDAEKAAEEKPADTPTTKKAKPHSHVEEKGGIVPKTTGQQAAKTNAAEDKSKHYHPRDGK